MPASLQTYEQALDFLYSRINYERIQSTEYTAGDFKLNRMRQLLESLGSPQEAIPAVHIAGTKGKGSTAVMAAEILSAAGYRTGLFTSPHLSAFEERMTVAGVQPTRDEVVDLVNALVEPVGRMDQAPGNMSPTYFEITCAMAWLYFRGQACHTVVLEVGMGGRLDATSVCHPAVCVITSISRDHTHVLGSELAQIAWEKAGIVKPGVPVISGVTASEAQQVVEEVCRERGAPLWQLGRDFTFEYRPAPARGEAEPPGLRPVPLSRLDLQTPLGTRRDLTVPMLGRHQAHNTALAVAAIERLMEAGWAIDDTAIESGLQKVRWPARIEVVGREPTVIIDAAHNWASVDALLRTLDESFTPGARTLVFGATRDKDVPGMLRQLLPRFETVILTCYVSNPRSVPPEHLLRMVRSLGTQPVHLAETPQAAWDLARRFSGAEDLICVTGSFFIAAEIREIIEREGADRASVQRESESPEN